MPSIYPRQALYLQSSFDRLLLGLWYGVCLETNYAPTMGCLHGSHWKGRPNVEGCWGATKPLELVPDGCGTALNTWSARVWDLARQGSHSRSRRATPGGVKSLKLIKTDQRAQQSSRLSHHQGPGGGGETGLATEQCWSCRSTAKSKGLRTLSQLEKPWVYSWGFWFST
jgi:hypothetical protein